MGPSLSPICLFVFLQSGNICVDSESTCVTIWTQLKELKPCSQYVCVWWECLRWKESPESLFLLTSVSPSHSLQGNMESFASPHYLLPCIAAFFLYVWLTCLSWSHLMLSCSNIGLCTPHFWVLCSQLYLYRNDIFCILKRCSLFSLHSRDIEASGLNLAHLHSRERKQDMFLSHTPINRKTDFVS